VGVAFVEHVESEVAGGAEVFESGEGGGFFFPEADSCGGFYQEFGEFHGFFPSVCFGSWLRQQMVCQLAVRRG